MTIALLHPPRHTALTPAYVRDTAAEMHAMVRLGRDPAGEKTEDRARAAETMIAVVQSYLTYQSGHLRPRSYRELDAICCGTANPYMSTRTLSGLITEAVEQTGELILSDRLLSVAKLGPRSALHFRLARRIALATTAFPFARPHRPFDVGQEQRPRGLAFA
jgi:hypothetical protein